jgi:hypothetical protein
LYPLEQSAVRSTGLSDEEKKLRKEDRRRARSLQEHRELSFEETGEHWAHHIDK